MECINCICTKCENTDCNYTHCKLNNPSEICYRFDDQCWKYCNEQEDIDEGLLDGNGVEVGWFGREFNALEMDL